MSGFLKLFTAATVISWASLAALAGTPEEDFDFAARLYKQKNYKLAEAAFGQFVKDHEKHAQVPTANFFRGICLSRLAKHKDARTLFRDMLRQNPNDPRKAEITYRIGRSSFLLKDFKSAQTEYKAFLNAHGGHSYRRYVLADYGQAQLNDGKPKDAATTFQQFLREFRTGPRVEDVQLSLAQTYVDLKQPRAALPLFESISKNLKQSDGTANPRAGDALVSLGKLHYQAANYDKAFAAFDGFLTNFKTDKRATQIQLWAGFCRYQQDSWDKAAALFQLAGSDAAIKTQADYWRGLAYKKLKKYGEAAELFAAVRKANPKDDLMAEAFYRQAECEMAISRHEAAKSFFLSVVDKHAKHPLADNALLGAIEAARKGKEFDEADKLIARFEQEFKTSTLLPSVQLGKAKVLYSRGTDADLKAAAEALSAAVKKTKDPQQLAEMQLWLGRTQVAQNEFNNALTALQALLIPDEKKLLPAVRPAAAEAWLPAAEAHFGNKDYDKASVAARVFVARRPNDAAGARAWQIIAISEQQEKNSTAAKTALSKLEAAAATNEFVSATTYQLAEIAYGQEDFANATTFYGSLAKQPKASTYHAAGLSGLGWSLFQQKKYADAAKQFQQVLTDHPADKRFGPEASYQAGRCYELAKDLESAATAYSKAFAAWKPAEPAKPDAEQDTTSPVRYAYLAGLQQARILRKGNKTEDAAKAYAALLESFPQPKNLDKLLNEWGGMHYDADEFAKADVLWKRIIAERPNSKLADDAALNLAESNLEAGKKTDAKLALAGLIKSDTTDDWVKSRARWHLIRLDFDAGKNDDVITQAAVFAKNHPKSDLLPEIRFYEAETLMRIGKTDVAEPLLAGLAKQQQTLGKHAWFARVLVLSAEIAWDKKEYAKVDQFASKFTKWNKEHPLAYQMHEVSGRAHKSRSNFEAARTAFSAVLSSKTGKATETAAKAQFLIAETYLEESLKKTGDEKTGLTRKALLAYTRVFATYPRYPDWQAPAQYQVGQCWETLRDVKEAIAAYNKLDVELFAKTEWATKARGRIKVLEAIPK